MNTGAGEASSRNVAQLVRASPRQGEGPRFESEHSYQLFSEAEKLVHVSLVLFCDSNHKKHMTRVEL